MQPMPVQKCLKQQPADQAREVWPPLAPVHAGATKDRRFCSRLRERFIEIQADSMEECKATFGDGCAVRREVHMPGSRKGVGKPDRDFTGQMIVEIGRAHV